MSARRRCGSDAARLPAEVNASDPAAIRAAAADEVLRWCEEWTHPRPTSESVLTVRWSSPTANPSWRRRRDPRSRDGSGLADYGRSWFVDWNRWCPTALRSSPANRRSGLGGPGGRPSVTTLSEGGAGAAAACNPRLHVEGGPMARRDTHCRPRSERAVLAAGRMARPEGLTPPLGPGEAAIAPGDRRPWPSGPAASWPGRRGVATRARFEPAGTDALAGATTTGAANLDESAWLSWIRRFRSGRPNPAGSSGAVSLISAFVSPSARDLSAGDGRPGKRGRRARPA